MRIILFNRFFFPDSSATSQIASDLAFALSARGYEVHAVTSRGLDLADVEAIRGVTIHRVGRSTKTASLALKALEYAHYYLGARQAAKRILRAGDIALVKTDPPMLAAAIGPIAKRRGAVLVSWLQDVFPEVAIEYGVPGTRLAAIRKLRNRWLRRSDRCIVISEAMKSRIVAEVAMDSANVRVIHNWAQGADIREISAEASPLRDQWNLREKFIVGYSGNLGRVHEFETILAAAAMLKPRADVAFLIVGGGPQLDRVVAAARERGLSNVHFRPTQARASLSESLGLPDVHLCVLRPEFEGLVVPSKIYGVMAAARPCIYIGDPQGEPAKLLTDEIAGLAVRMGDAAGLVEAIVRLKEDPGLRNAMGHNARHLFDERFDFPIAAKQWAALIEELRMKPTTVA